jgi:hypothetical protein
MSDRKTLIRLASALPKGSNERKAILAGLRHLGDTIRKAGAMSVSNQWAITIDSWRKLSEDYNLILKRTGAEMTRAGFDQNTQKSFLGTTYKAQLKTVGSRGGQSPEPEMFGQLVFSDEREVLRTAVEVSTFLRERLGVFEKPKPLSNGVWKVLLVRS